MQQSPILTLTYKVAIGAVTGRRFVQADSDSGEKVCNPPTTGASDKNIVGVAETDGAVGDHVPVVVSGTAIVEASGALSPSDFVETDSDGRAGPANTPGAFIVGMALTGASAAGDFVEVLLKTPSGTDTPVSP